MRSLANRTQESTEKIRNTIVRLQKSTQEAVEIISEITKEIPLVTDRAEKAGNSLSKFSSLVLGITNMNTQIASTAEQQLKVFQEISINIKNISNVAKGSETSLGYVDIANNSHRDTADRLTSTIA